MKSELAKDGKV